MDLREIFPLVSWYSKFVNVVLIQDDLDEKHMCIQCTEVLIIFVMNLLNVLFTNKNIKIQDRLSFTKK